MGHLGSTTGASSEAGDVNYAQYDQQQYWQHYDPSQQQYDPNQQQYDPNQQQYNQQYGRYTL